jgi:hypothetical protein
LERQILLAEDLDLTEKGKWSIFKKDLSETERRIGADKVFRKQTLDPWKPWALFYK